MARGIDLEKFFEAGVMEGPDGRKYSILIEKDISPTRQSEIMIEMLKGDLEIRGHVFVPEKKEK